MAWTSRVVAVVLCCAAGVVATSGPVPAAEPAPPRATWVWGRPDPAALTTFATERAVEDLFVDTPANLAGSAQRPWFEALRGESSPAGMRLHALGSDPAWLDDPQAALEWQADATRTGLFDGIHIDVEPWTRAGWDRKNQRTRLIASYVDLLDRLARASTLPVEADIPFWLGEHTFQRKPLDEAVLRRVDAVTVMVYRNRVSGPDSITALAERTLDVGQQVGRPVRLAVETNHLGDDPVARKQTFFGQTQGDLAGALAAVDAAEAAEPAYRGMAVHDQRGWAALAP